jgi:hypothetical protein
MSRKGRFAVLTIIGCFLVPNSIVARSAERFAIHEGAIAFQFNLDSLSALGFSLVPRGEMSGSENGAFMVFEVDPSNSPVAQFSKTGFQGLSNPVMTCGATLLDRPGERMVVGNFGLCGQIDEGFQIESTLHASAEPLVIFELNNVVIDHEASRGELNLRGELLLAPAWAEILTLPDAAGTSMGYLSVQLRVERAQTGSDFPGTCAPPEYESASGSAAEVTGSDIVVADLQNVVRYTSVGNMAAFGVGTTACNMGTARAEWISYNNRHPVISQNMYRLKDDRFEQIGMSWVKHGFFAVSESFCGPCWDVTNGGELGVGCSDPYSAPLNGVQSNMSPRSTVNAHTGYFAYPWSGPVAQSSVERRVQVRWSDLDPVLNPSAKYFVEGHYISPDDCRAGTQDNNASYRQVRIDNPSPGVFYLLVEPAWPTKAGQAAVRAWQDVDPDVFESDARVPGEGLFIVAAKVSTLGNGYYRYNYAVQNLNSDRSAQSFGIELPEHAIIQNPYFRDVLHHSGEPYSTLPWTYQLTSNRISWVTEPYEVNVNANALRFDSLFTFAFDTNVEPQPGKIDLGLFKPGMPQQIAAGSLVPRLTIIDCNQNGSADRCDLDCSEVACTEPCGTSSDCNANLVPDDCEPDCNENGVADDCDLNQCPPGDWRCADCNANAAPDECDADCDGDNLIDECETVTDTDLDGVEDCDDLCPYTTPQSACLPPFDTMVVCCFHSGIYMEDMYTWRQCAEFGATPVCDDPPMCPGTPCLASACRAGCLIGDNDSDGDLDLEDYAGLQSCFGEASPQRPGCSDRFDFTDDQDVDTRDYREFSDRCSGPGF